MVSVVNSKFGRNLPALLVLGAMVFAATPALAQFQAGPPPVAEALRA